MTDVTTTATKIGRQATEKAREFANTNPLALKAKDALYTAVGAGVLGAQKANAAAKSANLNINFDTEAIKRGVSELTSNVKSGAAHLDERLEVAFKAIDTALAPIEDKLPASVRETRLKVRDFATKFVSHAASTDADVEVDEK